MRIVLLLAHSIEEYDQVRLLHSLGHEVFSLGSYIDPARPMDPIRPALPQVPCHRELKAVVDALGQQGHADPLDAAKRHLPDEIIDWADVIICHHLEHTWLVPQWDRLRHKRVIWRTVGQSVQPNEWMMAPLQRDGLQIVRYSPQERNIPDYAGEDALIRFWKDPEEWDGWHGSDPYVTNVTQDLAGRDPFTNWRFWEAATHGLPRVPAGPKSERIGGLGTLSLEAMQVLLRGARCYLYTGTQPASYTLGLIEAMMTGIPVVSIGPSWMRLFPYSPLLFEGHLIAPLSTDRPDAARGYLTRLISDPDWARQIGAESRSIALDLFSMDRIGQQWQDFLAGRPVRHAERDLATA